MGKITGSTLLTRKRLPSFQVPDRRISPPPASPNPSPPSRGRRGGGFFSALFGRGRGTNDSSELTVPKPSGSRKPRSVRLIWNAAASTAIPNSIWLLIESRTGQAADEPRDSLAALLFPPSRAALQRPCRQALEPEQALPSYEVRRMPWPADCWHGPQVPTAMHMDEGEELDTVSVSEVRRSLSEPLVARRSALDLGTPGEGWCRSVSALKGGVY